ncbi:MAG: HD domain-containing protein [Chloroflexi bacterium]|nr:HD domain-containing protein [Chloroflexota bacterium]
MIAFLTGPAEETTAARHLEQQPEEDVSKVLVSDIREGQDVTALMMIRGRQLRPFRGRVGNFLVLKLADRSGEIEAKLWENGDDWYWRLREEDVVKVQGRSQVYNGSLELILERLRLAREEEYDLEDFLPSTERDVAEMVRQLQSVMEGIANPFLADLLRRLFDEETLERFARAPAAKVVHHAYLGGLIEHTLEVIKLCETALEIYPSLDRELLLTAAILHDVGKVREYVYRRCIDFSDEGRLLGHIALGEEVVVSTASQVPGFPGEVLVKLRHMVLSHHGQYEWQSPKRPKTIEACVLHLADYFSGQVAIFASLIKANQTQDTSWTAYNKFLERSVFIGGAIPRLIADEEGDVQRKLMEERYEGY